MLEGPQDFTTKKTIQPERLVVFYIQRRCTLSCVLLNVRLLKKQVASSFNTAYCGLPAVNTRKKLVQGGFHKAVGKNCLFATVHDAVACATLVHKVCIFLRVCLCVCVSPCVCVDLH